VARSKYSIYTYNLYTAPCALRAYRHQESAVNHPDITVSTTGATESTTKLRRRSNFVGVWKSTWTKLPRLSSGRPDLPRRMEREAPAKAPNALSNGEAASDAARPTTDRPDPLDLLERTI
jgi:hypothetical protein